MPSRRRPTSWRLRPPLAGISIPGSPRLTRLGKTAIHRPVWYNRHIDARRRAASTDARRRGMIEKYTRPQMGLVWSEERRIALWLKVEIAICEAWAEEGVVPADALPAI